MTTTVFFRTSLSEPVVLPAPRGTGLAQDPGDRHPGPGRGPIRAAIREGWRRWRSRTALAELPPHILKDIGVTPTEAWYEARKPFWRA